MAFEFPEPIELKTKLKDILEPVVDEKFYLSDEQVASFKASTAKAQAKGNGFKFEPLERESNCAYSRNSSREQTNRQLYQGTIRLGGLYDKPGRKHQAGSIYEKNGIAPTLSTMQGGNLEPMIVASRGRGNPPRQRLEARKDNLTNTITSVEKDNYVLYADSDKNSE